MLLAVRPLLTFWGKNVTIFLEAVTTNPMAAKPAFAQGAQIEHGKFGLGSVMSCNEEHIVIRFDEHGEKELVLSIVLPNLKNSHRQPPAAQTDASRNKSEPADE